MEAREEIPRVSMGSVQDWQRVRSNYKDAALSQLRERLATSKSLIQEQESIQSHLQHFIDRTFSLAQANLRINGTNFESLDQTGTDTDIFDETLDRRIWSLADTRLQWHKRIAERRRTAPKEVEGTISELLEKHRDLDAILLPVGSEEVVEEDVIAEEDALQQQGVEHVLQKTFALVNELDQTVVSQHERGDRVRNIATEVKSLKP
ncbi:hypothetical protein CPC08DRAFT_680979 [Agrocybe pediades]|nr:hypothetical protein CPC08DRAFT_680979 [Agrocybe pediades]